MLESIKVSLRIKTDAFDAEINDLISAALKDLNIAGILLNDNTDPLIKRAVSIYVTANFGRNNPDADRLQASYVTLKQHLALSGDYNVG